MSITAILREVPRQRMDWGPTVVLLLLALPLDITRPLDMGIQLHTPAHDLPGVLVLALALAQAVPLGWRRRCPSVVAAVVGPAFLVDQWIGVPPNETQWAVLFALYAVAANDTMRRIVSVAAVAVAAMMTTAVAATLAGLPGTAPPTSLGAAVLLFVGLPMLAGWLVRGSGKRAAGNDPQQQAPQQSTEDPSATEVAPSKLASLTTREREVLMLLLRGYSNPEIASALFISRNTTKTHVAHILKKLDVPDRTQVLLFAQQHGLTSDTLTANRGPKPV